MTAPADVPAAVWAALRSCKVFGEASDASLAWLARVSSVHQYNKGDRVLSGTSAAHEIGVVMRGHVRAVHFGTDGRPVTVLMAWPCEPIGLMAALAGDDYGTTFESAENNTAIVLFKLEAFTRLTRDEPDVLISTVRELARQMTDMVTMVKTLAVDVPARVAIYIGLLLEEQVPIGAGPFTIDLAVSRVELAARLGTVPETLSRAFSLLQNEHIIESHGQEIVVLDRDALIDRTNGVL